MKSLSCLVVLAGLAGTTLAASAHAAAPPGAATPKPRALVFEPEGKGAVEAFLFSTVEIPFQVRNDGDKPVRILDITPRRGAGRGSAEPEVLSPGARGRVILRREVGDLGTHPYGFRVHTDDPAGADYPVRARVFGMSAYTPDQPSINFEVARAGRTTAQRLTVSSYESASIELKTVVESPAWLDVRAVPRVVGESTQDLVIEARVRANAPRGLLRGTVHLLTSVPTQPELIIPVQAHVFDTVAASPMPATMKPAYIGESRQVEVEYRSLDGKALLLDTVVDSTRALKLQSRACGPNCVKVSAEFKTTRAGEFGGVLRARFKQRAESLDVGWDILVVNDKTALHDLGTIGGEEDDDDRDAAKPGENR